MRLSFIEDESFCGRCCGWQRVKKTSRPLCKVVGISKNKTLNRLLAFHSRFAKCTTVLVVSTYRTDVWNEKTLFKEVFHYRKVIVLMYVLPFGVLFWEKKGSILYEVLNIRYSIWFRLQYVCAHILIDNASIVRIGIQIDLVLVWILMHTLTLQSSGFPH